MPVCPVISGAIHARETFELAVLLVSLNHVARVIANANHRIVVHADEKLTAFLELEVAIRVLAAWM